MASASHSYAPVVILSDSSNIALRDVGDSDLSSDDSDIAGDDMNWDAPATVNEPLNGLLLSTEQDASDAPPSFRCPCIGGVLNVTRRERAVALICLTSLLMFADQNLMAPNLTDIAHDFGFTDDERDEKLGGEIAVAFFLLGAPAALAVGYFADRTQCRVRLLAAVVFAGELPCLLTAFVVNYTQLFWLRAATGSM